MPQLNHARQSHSSCALNSFVYVFGGDNATVNLLDSIERMQISSDSGYPAPTSDNLWELIQVVQQSGHNLQRLARMSSIFCAIEETEILIAGGYLNGDNEDGHASDAYILDTKTLEVHSLTV